MAAASRKSTREDQKSKKKRKKSCLFFLGSCFGDEEKEMGGVEKVKESKLSVRKSSSSGRTVPIITESPSQKIQVVEAAEVTAGISGRLLASPPPRPHQLNNTKTMGKSESLNQLSGARKRTSIEQSENQISSPIERSQSISLPLARQQKDKVAAGGREMEEQRAGDPLDPIIGAIIVTVTLVVMVIWGKVCAILCVAAWFYLIPRVRSNFNNGTYAAKNRGGSNLVDLDSFEYKKKVVLEGFLERHQHI